MNILFISPSNNIGGAEISLMETIKFLELNKVRCYVLMPKSIENLYGQVLEKLATKVFYHKIPIFSEPKIKFLSIGSIISKLYHYHKNGLVYSAVKYIQSIIKSQKIDLVHTNTVHSIVGKMAANKEKIPHVLHLREITGNSNYSHVILKNQSKTNFKEKFGEHDGLIANSYFCLNENKSYFKGKVEKIIYNPVNSEFQSLTIKNNTLGMVANVTSSLKKHSEFISICNVLKRQNSNLKYKIFGKLPPSDNSYFIHLNNLIKEFKLSESFEFMGLCENNKIYNDVDILLHPYPNESFGRIFIEAMAAGVPVIAASAGGALELIVNNETGLLYEVGNIVDAAEKVSILNSNLDLREKLIKNGKLKAKEFTPEIVLSELIGFYKAVVENYQK
jgi:glycosyltransferase involved in cell wall biosynthesis